MSKQRETEIKFVFTDPSAWNRLRRLKRLGSLRKTRQVRELQKNIYWDTPGGKLFRRKAVLKLRQVRAGRVELTFKKESSRQGKISRRVEITAAVRTMPRGTVMPESWLQLKPVLMARRLVLSKKWIPAITMQTDRTRFFFSASRPLVEIDLDELRLKVRGKIVRHRELELENIALPQKQFSQIVRIFTKAWAGKLKPSRLSKQQIAFRLMKMEE
jgi:inorganic triphosphatase YgiF